jgi:peroxiredoxin
LKRLAVVAIAALLCLGAAKVDPREASLRKSVQLAPDAKMQYFDETGRALSFDAFFAQVMKGRQFGYEHEGKVAAIVRLSPLEAARPRSLRSPGIKAGAAFPAFALKTAAGVAVTGAALRGRLTLFNFFFADCVPCIKEIPALNAYARHHPEVQVLAVTFDDAAIARTFAAQRKLQWPILADGQGLISEAGVTGFPTFILVGPDAKVRAVAAGAEIAGKGRALDVASLSTWVASNRKAAP